MVLALALNDATSKPSTLPITIVVSPMLAASALATCLTRLFLVVLASSCRARFGRPFLIRSVTALGKSLFNATASLGSSRRP